MNKKTQASLAKELQDRRKLLFKEVVDIEADLQFIAEDRESELEERAQEERAAQLFARLDIRGKRAIEQIDAALHRMAAGTYGTCTECGRSITVTRLRAQPATCFCIDCARAEDARPQPTRAETEAEHGEPPPADLRLMTDREMETALREQVRDDGRVDLEELRIVCRHGVVYLDGVLPSEAEHQMLFKLVTDVAGFHEVVDRVQVKELPWERGERSTEERTGEEPTEVESSETEDIVKSREEGIGYVPPYSPPPEEEE